MAVKFPLVVSQGNSRERPVSKYSIHDSLALPYLENISSLIKLLRPYDKAVGMPAGPTTGVHTLRDSRPL